MFAAVKKILDDLMTANIAQNGQADLTVHIKAAGEKFSWATKEDLLASKAFGVLLVQPEVVGNGRGAEANLVIDLTTGLPRRPRMPFGGPFLDPKGPEIATIIAWIDGGCQ